MKKLSSAIILTSTFLFITVSAGVAQDRGFTTIGVGPVYDADIGAAGIQANATIRIFERIVIAPDINIYFPGGDETPHAIESLWSANLNGHLILIADSEYQVYGLGGLNASFVKLEQRDDAGTDYGLNIGAGGEYHLSTFTIFGEGKYMIKSNRSPVFSLGIRYPLN